MDYSLRIYDLHDRKRSTQQVEVSADRVPTKGEIVWTTGGCKNEAYRVFAVSTPIFVELQIGKGPRKGNAQKPMVHAQKEKSLEEAIGGK